MIDVESQQPRLALPPMVTEQETDNALHSNLTLLLPPRIPVDFLECEESIDAQGETVIVERVRRASISSFVPMKIFHQMLASRVARRFSGGGGGKAQESVEQDPEQNAAMMEWMQDMVFAVWKRSEPHMTRERFENGLQMDTIMELFNRFFADSMQRLGERSRYVQATRNPVS